MCVVVVCFSSCDITNFEINLVFLIKPFFYMIKESRQKFKYLENKKALREKQKAFFVIFNGLSVKEIYLRHECAPLTIIGFQLFF